MGNRDRRGARERTTRKEPRRQRPSRSAAPTSWDPLAPWYDGWVGEGGSHHHQRVAIPAVLKLLDLEKGERILDIGAGQGVLAPYVHEAGGLYTGVDASPRLLDMARKRHGKEGDFVLGDARRLAGIKPLQGKTFDAMVFLLSLQDMDPLETVLASCVPFLVPQGRLVILLTHPAFRVPRQSGWGWDEGRKLVYRRIDRYLTPLPVPMKPYPGREASGVTRSFHRPLSTYINDLAAQQLLVDQLVELPGYKLDRETGSAKAQGTARKEIPLFLGLRARRCGATV